MSLRESEHVHQGGFLLWKHPQFHAPRWVTGWLSWESTSERLIGRTGFGEHKRYLIPSVEWGSALIWVLISSTYSIEEWTGTMLCLRYVPSYIKIAIYFALWFKCFVTVIWACGSADEFVCICSREHIICVCVVSKIHVWNGHCGVFMWAEWTVADLVTKSPIKKGGEKERDKIRPSSRGHYNSSERLNTRFDSYQKMIHVRTDRNMKNYSFRIQERL